MKEDLMEIGQTELENPETKKQKVELDITVESDDLIASELAASIEKRDLDKFKTIVDGNPEVLRNRNIFTVKIKTSLGEISTQASYEHLLAIYGFSEGMSYIVDNNIYANWNCLAKHDSTPLMFAAQFGHTATVEKLVALGAEVNQANEYGGTPLAFAAEFGHTATVEKLVALGADVDQVNNDGDTPLTFAAANGHTATVEKLIALSADVNKHDDYGNIPLMNAVENDHTETVKILIAAGSDLNQVNTENGNTPLILAAEKGHTEIAKILIAAGADLNKVNEYNDTPLRMAAEYGHLETAKILIAADADLNKIGIYHYNPLMIAAEKGYTKIAKILIAAGANINKSNKYGDTPLILAAGKAKMEIQRSNKVNSSKNGELTPLPSDAQYLEVVRALLKTNKVNLTTKDEAGKDAIAYAKEAGLSDIVRTIELYANFRSLLEEKDHKLALLTLISPEHELAAKDFEFIKELTYQVLQDKWKFNNDSKELNELIAKLYIDTNIAPANNNDPILLQKHAFSYNLAINDTKEQVYAYVATKRAELCRLEKLLVQAYYDDDLAELIDNDSKHAAIIKGKQETQDNLCPEGILGLQVSHYKENGVIKYKATSEVFGKGEILRKFFDKIQNSTAPSSEILSPLMINKDDFNQFELYFSLIKTHLPLDFQNKGESLIKTIKEEHAKPTFELLAITVDNNNYLKEEVTELKSQLHSLKEHNSKLLGFITNLTKLLSDNGIKGAGQLLDQFIGEGQSMEAESNPQDIQLDSNLMENRDIEFTGNHVYNHGKEEVI
jgi:ankyrin repeat protein